MTCVKRAHKIRPKQVMGGGGGGVNTTIVKYIITTQDLLLTIRTSRAKILKFYSQRKYFLNVLRSTKFNVFTLRV